MTTKKKKKKGPYDWMTRDEALKALVAKDGHIEALQSKLMNMRVGSAVEKDRMAAEQKATEAKVKRLEEELTQKDNLITAALKEAEYERKRGGALVIAISDLSHSHSAHGTAVRRGVELSDKYVRELEDKVRELEKKLR